MPVKKVPGGYRLMAPRKDPGGKKDKREYQAKKDSYMVMQQEGDGGPGMLGLPEGLGDASVSMPQGTVAASPKGTGKPAPVDQAGAATIRSRRGGR